MKEKSRLRVWFNSLSLRVMAGTIFLTLTAALFIGALAGMFIRRQLKDQLAAQSRQQAEYLMRTVDIGVIAPCYSEISHLRVNAAPPSAARISVQLTVRRISTTPPWGSF